MSSYLIHYGIQGQHWGIRNGPPYPLGSSQKSSSEKNAEKYRGLKLTDKQKKLIKIGAAVAATGLMAYGAYKLQTSGAEIVKKDTVSGESITRLVTGKSPNDIDINLVKSINSDSFDTEGGKINCFHCTTSYLLNTLFGKDCVALPFSGVDEVSGLKTNGRSLKLFDAIFENISHIDIEDIVPVTEIYDKIPNGSTGALVRTDLRRGASHVINYEKDISGKLTLIDCQSGDITTDWNSNLSKHANKGRYISEILDFSNAKLRDNSDEILKHIIK